MVVVDCAHPWEIFISILPSADREPGGYEVMSYDYNDYISDRTYQFC
jgi:hypothetical protein